ncbi:MAG: hypothetical protein JWQ96_816 [Segetibacter sp.]|jgi:hypothetical protein|nr:hypothetical protein [Segetibacter sp.]
MKKQLFSIAACLLILTSCSNDNTPSQGETDDEYRRTFEHNGDVKKDAHNNHAPEQSKDHTDSKEGMTDSTHLPAHGTGAAEHHADTTKHL